PDALQVEPAAVVLQFEQDFVAFLAHREADLAGLGLAGGNAFPGRLDAVGNRVAQEMLDGRSHALEHAAIDFDIRSADVERDPLAELLRRLADHPVETVAEGAE